MLRIATQFHQSSANIKVIKLGIDHIHSVNFNSFKFQHTIFHHLDCFAVHESLDICIANDGVVFVNLAKNERDFGANKHTNQISMPQIQDWLRDSHVPFGGTEEPTTATSVP